MIVTFNAQGGGSASGALDYLYSDKDHTGKEREVEPETIAGDPELTQELINEAHGKFKKCYTSGTLSFEEENIPESEKFEIMQSFEETLLAGLESNEYNVLWVEHRDKDRLELNFVIPRIHVPTGAGLQPYFAPADETRVDAWKDMVNIDYELTDPKAPDKRRALDSPYQLPKGAKDIREALTSYLLNADVEDRNDLVDKLNSFDGVTVSRQTKTSVSITTPEHGKPIRLKGELYHEDYRASQATNESRERAQRDFETSKHERRERAERTHGTAHKIASDRNRTKYDRITKNFNKKRDKGSKRTSEKSENQNQRTDIDTQKRADNSINNQQHRVSGGTGGGSGQNDGISNENQPRHETDRVLLAGELLSQLPRQETERRPKTEQKTEQKIKELFNESNDTGTRRVETGKGGFADIIADAERNNSQSKQNYSRVREIYSDAREYTDRARRAIRDNSKRINEALKRQKSGFKRFFSRNKGKDKGQGFER